MRPSLDFDLLPPPSFFESRSILRTMSRDLEERLESLAESHERARGAVLFAESPKGEAEPWVAAAFLRAALGELCALEGSFQRDLGDRWNHAPLPMLASRDPLLHLSKMLRNCVFHVETFPVQPQEVLTTWGEQSFPHHIWVITDLSEAYLRRRRETSSYSTGDLGAMIHWFDAAQRHWGAGYLFKLAVERYCGEVASRVSL